MDSEGTLTMTNGTGELPTIFVWHLPYSDGRGAYTCVWTGHRVVCHGGRMPDVKIASHVGETRDVKK